jgi:hypothetical protein
MSGIRHNSAGFQIPSTGEPRALPQEPKSQEADTLLPAGAAAELESMIDEVERLVGDPVLAREVIRVELDRRDSHSEECEPRAESDRDLEQVEPARPGQSMGGAMPTRPEQSVRPRRFFAGFDRERATYEQLKPELLAQAEGKFVVIVGDEVVGPLETDEDAERAGYARFGLGPLYIRQILAEEPVTLITRDVVPCRI